VGRRPSVRGRPWQNGRAGAEELEPVANDRLGLLASERVDVDLEEEPEERLPLGCGDPAPEVVERVDLGPEQARLAAPDLGCGSRVWLGLASGFSAAGAALVTVTVAGLVGLAAAQAATLRA
jgi:hypothetical protein